MKVGDTVRCIRGHSGTLEEGGIYEVLVVVEQGSDYKGPISTPGAIVRTVENAVILSHPYVWDLDRFERVERVESWRAI